MNRIPGIYQIPVEILIDHNRRNLILQIEVRRTPIFVPGQVRMAVEGAGARAVASTTLLNPD